MNPAHLTTSIQSWPGLDDMFRTTAHASLSTDEAVKFQSHVAGELHRLRGKPCLVGRPLAVKAEYGQKLARFATAYHDAIETIVRAWSHDEAVRRILSAPPALRRDMELNYSEANGHVHLCRLDLHLDAAGGFHVLETNANCPAALMSSGKASAMWREFLAGSDVAIPRPLDHELPGWTARWFIELATIETGLPPNFVALFRERDGNRLEFPGFTSELRKAGVDTREVDPREVTQTSTGDVIVNDQRIRHGYLKLGLQSFSRMRDEMDEFVAAVQRRSIFVQNGLHGRLLGDNKLCLAILSDPTFEYLFPGATIETIREHIPWSRYLPHCSNTEVNRIKNNRSEYVLKQPFDTRGRGVVVGRGLKTNSEWTRAVETGIHAGWLVQQFIETTESEPDTFENDTRRHDLSIGLINGKLSGAFARSGTDLRLNLARTGKLHPVFMGL